MNKFLRELLVSPVDQKSELVFDEMSGSFYCNDEKYDIQNNIPIMLVNRARENVAVTAQHEKADTKFNYVDHYIIDAEEFDYFNESHKGANYSENQFLHKNIISEIPSNAKNILDVGCGSAWLAKALCSKGYNIISMDIAYKNTFKAQIAYDFENHFQVVADVFNLPFKENSIDCIVASEIIEHVPNPGKFISCLYKILKPGGVLIITTPYNEQLVYSLCIHCNKSTPQHAHIHSFNEKNIQTICDNENIKIDKIKKFNNRLLFKFRLYHLLRHLDFAIWNLFDKIANKISNKSIKLMIKIKK